MPPEKQEAAVSITSTPDSTAFSSVMYAIPVVQWVWRIRGMSPTSSLIPQISPSASAGDMVPAISFRHRVSKPMFTSSRHISTYFFTVWTGLWV